MSKRDVFRVELNRANLKKSELISLRNELAKETNLRLLSLEKADFAYGAYDLALNFLHKVYRRKERFSTGKGKHETKAFLKRQIVEMQYFLTRESSTVEGQLAIKSRIKETLERNLGLEISEDKDFFDFLSSSQYKNIVNRGISSEQLQKFFVRNYKGTKDSWNEIMDALKDFEENKINSIDELYKIVGSDFWRYEGEN